MQKPLSAKVLFLVAIGAYAISFVLGNDSIIGQAAGTLGLLIFLFAVIAAVREYRAKRSTPKPPSQ